MSTRLYSFWSCESKSQLTPLQILLKIISALRTAFSIFSLIFFSPSDFCQKPFSSLELVLPSKLDAIVSLCLSCFWYKNRSLCRVRKLGFSCRTNFTTINSASARPGKTSRVSLYNGESVGGPLKPFDTIVLWCFDRFLEVSSSIGYPWLPKDASPEIGLQF